MNKYNTFWRRFFAGLIDSIIFIPIGLIDLLIVDSKNTLILTISAIISYSSFYLYTVYFHWSTGQTIGKKWMDIRVVDKSESRLLTLKQSFMRDSIYILLETIGLVMLISKILQFGQYPYGESTPENYLDSLTTLWLLVELGTMLTNERRRAVHDSSLAAWSFEKSSGTPNKIFLEGENLPFRNITNHNHKESVLILHAVHPV